MPFMTPESLFNAKLAMFKDVKLWFLHNICVGYIS